MIIAVTCNDFGFILRIIGALFKVMQWVVPILLIVLIVFDFLKVVTGSADEKAKSEALAKAGKRFIYAIVVFLIPVLVKMTFRVIGNRTTNGGYSNANSTTSWVSCFNEYFK